MKSLVWEFERKEHPAVLDLGPANGENVSFLSQFACRLSIADLYQSWRGSGATDVQRREMFATMCAQVLEFEDDRSFDYIFAWDLLNYLELHEIDTLRRCLEKVTAPRATLFGIVSIRKLIPAVPIQYSIVDKNTLRYDSSVGTTRQCPLYKEPELTRALRGYEVESTYLLRHGVQEYLFVRREEPDPAKPDIGSEPAAGS